MNETVIDTSENKLSAVADKNATRKEEWHTEEKGGENGSPRQIGT